MINIVGASVFVAQVASIIVLLVKLCKLSKEFSETPEESKRKWSSMFYEFEANVSDVSLMYYPLFLLRRLLYLLVLYYLSMFPLLQITCLLYTSDAADE